ncbi:hypothetical protein SAMN06265222_106135 [Neorhodopirellula lusitana]|uniref:Uncharacterized protein n=1 Tax=Neorhodopirellula lusitana TaxID=445327 RepID=A0ABY1Q872_9BACT|nr:hypothetical protein [Neorhodopirellula lusitana]SMP58855.1 hypothetical protein SAMN06265222_106135 [Neorhodopirellula lusitana]
MQIPEPSAVPNSDGCSLQLRDDFIVETIAKLQQRISERFPDSGLCSLCGDLLQVARQASQRSQIIDRPILWIRVAGYTMAVSLVILLLWVLATWVRLPTQDITEQRISLSLFLATIETVSNEVILLGAGIYFLISLETRIKRKRALSAVHELRSLCHIIDMHQLTKDPERILAGWKSTTNSPRQHMTPLELNRYLDYCSEMLSLTGKIAALYVRRFDDSASVAAVSEVEQLSTGLSRKIWQKIIILNQSVPPGEHRHLSPPGDLTSPGDTTSQNAPPRNHDALNTD